MVENPYLSSSSSDKIYFPLLYEQTPLVEAGMLEELNHDIYRVIYSFYIVIYTVLHTMFYIVIYTVL